MSGVNAETGLNGIKFKNIEAGILVWCSFKKWVYEESIFSSSVMSDDSFITRQKTVSDGVDSL